MRSQSWAGALGGRRARLGRAVVGRARCARSVGENVPVQRVCACAGRPCAGGEMVSRASSLSIGPGVAETFRAQGGSSGGPEKGEASCSRPR